jgi:hypothetical protein
VTNAVRVSCLRVQLRPTVAMLNTVIAAFAAVNDQTNAEKYFAALKELRLDPNADSFNPIIEMHSR